MKIFQTIKTSTPGTALETIPGLEVPALPEKIAKIDQAGSNDFQAKLGESFMKFREALILALRDPTSLGLGGDTKAAAGFPSLIPISLIQESSTLKVMTSSERNKLAGIETGAQVNTVTSVQGRIGSVVVNASDVGLGDVDNTSDMNKPVSTAQATAINARLPKLTYVGVSMNGASLTASVGKMYGIYATGVTITLPSATSIGDGEVIGFVIGVNASRTLQINTTANQDLVTPDGVKTTGYAVTGFARTVYAVCYFHTWMLCGLEDSAIDDAVAPLAPLASPALTGTPTAPTPAPGTNTTQIATTAFCESYVRKWTYSYSNYGGAINAVAWTMHAFGASGTLTLPLASSVASGVQVAAIVVLGGAEVVLTRSGSDQFVTPTGLATSYTLKGNGSSIVLVRVTASAWACVGAPDSLIADAIAPLAPLASPALTGTPTAPTAAAGTNTTQLATTAFVLESKTMTFTNIGFQANISAVANNIYGLLTASSGSVITLPTGANYTYQIGEEIVVIIGSTGLTVATIQSGDYIIKAGGLHPKNTPINLSLSGTTIVFRRASENAWLMLYPEYELALKAPLASPALTGTPTAPTPAPGTNTTQLATTAFVTGSLAGKQDASNAVTTNTEQVITGVKTYNNIAPLRFDRTSGGYYPFQFFFEGEYQWRWYQTGVNIAVQHRDIAGNYTNVMSFHYTNKRVQFNAAPTVPTATSSDNSTLAASTAFVQAKASGALLTEGTPSGPTATGTKGMARFDANYYYVCTATNTWVRFAKDGSWT